MLIKQSKRRGPKTKDCQPSSFRFDDETRRRLASVSAYANKKQTAVMEELIDKAYDEIKAKKPLELKKAEKLVGDN
jgi:hypothetical protein